MRARDVMYGKKHLAKILNEEFSGLSTDTVTRLVYLMRDIQLDAIEEFAEYVGSKGDVFEKVNLIVKQPS